MPTSPGVIIHTGSEASGNSSYEIDLAPTTTTFDSLLDPGQTFVDSALGLSFATLSADSTGALVSVSFDSGACIRNNPTVSLSPAQSPWLQAGSTFSYTVSVSNTDSLGCAASSFNMAVAAPAGWAATFGSPSFSIAPGSNVSTTLQVTSPSSVASGSYGVSAAVTNGSDATKAASASTTYLVAPSSLTVQVWPGQSTYGRNQSAKLSASVLAGSTPASGASVTFTVTKPNGSIVRGTATADASGTATYGLRLRAKDPVGTYQVVAAAILNGATGSAGTSFVVQ